MVREFNPSNEPETCLFCGTKLRYSVWKAHRYTNTVTLCCQAPIDFATVRDSSTLAGWRNSRACQTCHREITGIDDTEDVEVVRPEKRSAQPGKQGLFCTIDCGFQFGVLAATKGVRYVRRDPS